MPRVIKSVRYSFSEQKFADGNTANFTRCSVCIMNPISNITKADQSFAKFPIIPWAYTTPGVIHEALQ